VLSRRNFKFKKLYTYIVFIPMVFNGGMVANYLVMTKLLDLKNNILALILPIAVASFYVIILRTFFTTTIPDSIIESGKIDGAGQIRIFYTLVLPISLPAIATIGLFLSFSYWNDWFHALMYLNERDLFPLQYVLIQIEKNIEFMASGSSHLGISASEILAKMPAESTKMALVVLAVIPIAASYPFFQKYFVSGLTVGAVKG
ncbi:MAG: carbohydrate ABC transporter permease, partial [Oscillospiraceae bacterium]